MPYRRLGIPSVGLWPARAELISETARKRPGHFEPVRAQSPIRDLLEPEKGRTGPWPTLLIEICKSLYLQNEWSGFKK